MEKSELCYISIWKPVDGTQFVDSIQSTLAFIHGVQFQFYDSICNTIVLIDSICVHVLIVAQMLLINADIPIQRYYHSMQLHRFFVFNRHTK